MKLTPEDLAALEFIARHFGTVSRARAYDLQDAGNRRVPPGYQARQFVAVDQRRHESADPGTDYCTCGAGFMAHYNGHCPL